MNPIEYFCNTYGITGKELAKVLGVTSEQLSYWNAGTKEIPPRYCKKIKKVFSIPDDKGYLLQKPLLSEQIQGEITLIYYRKLVENFKKLEVEDSEDSRVRTANLRQLEWKIISAERQLEFLNLTKECESIIKSKMSDCILLSEEDYRRKKNVIQGIMNIMKEM